MSNLHIPADLGFKTTTYNVELPLVEFKEEKVVIIYSPALDLSGSGYSIVEAKKSFSEALHEFFRYTNNKKTLDKVLKDLGWTIKGSKKKPKFNPPKASDLVISNPLYNEIVNKKSYKVSRENVEFAF
ncbi:MAG: hypothetical protein JJE45_04020 [Prolixibacteraceae bacterium]|nr:hypothetical protein [Prolixibacteraceae bacterium]